jgi:putative phosphoesterase
VVSDVTESSIEVVVGVVADTHGLLRPKVLEALQGSHVIVHAGDVGRPEILDALREIAPVHAVRGNVDRGGWAQALPSTEVVQAGDALLYVLHDVGELDLDPVAAGFHAVIFGHSHRPGTEIRNGVLFLNPGSAGPRRFRLPVTVAKIAVQGTLLAPVLVTLKV